MKIVFRFLPAILDSIIAFPSISSPNSCCYVSIFSEMDLANIWREIFVFAS